MVKDKVLYANDIILMVASVYGKESLIFKSIMNGEKISSLVKMDIKKKGKNAYKKIKAKKELLKKCLEQETSFVNLEVIV